MTIVELSIIYLILLILFLLALYLKVVETNLSKKQIDKDLHCEYSNEVKTNKEE